MPIREPHIRDGLPDGGEAVESTLIEAFIASWERRVELEAGSEHKEDPMALDVIRFGATGDARAIYDEEEGRAQSPVSERLIKRAEAILTSLDKLTGSPTEGGRVNDTHVTNVKGGPFWTFEDFGFEEGV